MSRGEVLRPGAESVDVVFGKPVFLRDDVVKAQTAAQWRQGGYTIRQHEEPCKLVVFNGHVLAMYGEWQTQSEPNAVVGSGNDLVNNMLLQTEDSTGEGVRAPLPAAASERQPVRRRRAVLPLKASPPKAGVTRPSKPSLRRRPQRGKKPQVLLDFETVLEELSGWLASRGHLPWEKSADRTERRLAAWVSKVRAAHANDWLTREQVALVSSLKAWRWNNEAGGNPPRHVTAPSCSTTPAEKCEGRWVESPGGLSAASPPSRGAVGERWIRCTMQRLARDLAKQASSTMRKARLRQFQLTYHPDKNPGRADEVLPIFRWVQSCWDREFRGAETVPEDFEAQGEDELPTQQRGPQAQNEFPILVASRNLAQDYDRPRESYAPVPFEEGCQLQGAATVPDVPPLRRRLTSKRCAPEFAERAAKERIAH